MLDLLFLLRLLGLVFVGFDLFRQLGQLALSTAGFCWLYFMRCACVDVRVGWCSLQCLSQHVTLSAWHALHLIGSLA